MKDPAFLFYPGDFITGTMFMSNEQVGIYTRLLCAQHQHGGAINKAAFNSLVGTDQILRSKFIETEHGFYNERLITEMDMRAKKSNNISTAMQKVWDSKRKLKESYKKTKRKLEAIVNEDEDININKDVIENRKLKFYGAVEILKQNYSNEMLKSFCEYWTEYNPNGSKMLFEMQKTFEISKRLARWFNNQKTFNNNGTGKQQTARDANGNRLDNPFANFDN